MELASICRRAHTELEGTAILSRSRGRDRWFESTFLQRRVACEPEDDIDIPVPRHILGRPRTASSGDQSPCSSHRRVESCARQVQQIGHGESGAAHFRAIARARLKDETNYRWSLGTNTVLGLVTNGLLAVLPDGGAENWSLGPPGSPKMVPPDCPFVERPRSSDLRRVPRPSAAARYLKAGPDAPAISPFPSTSSANPMQTPNPAAAGSIPLALPASLQSKREQ
jgi:hypothetical protein